MEYGILVIKPDGMEPYIRNLIIDKLQTAKLEVIESYTQKLSYYQAREMFFTSAFDVSEYYSYLSSGNMQILLVKGDYAISKLRNIKYEIRENFLCEKSMKNILHTCDTGNEYKMQFTKLFSHLRYEEHLLFADMHVPLEKYIKQINSNQWLQAKGIIIRDKELKQDLRDLPCSPNDLVGIKAECEFEGKTISIICYFRTQEQWYLKAKHLAVGDDTSIDMFVRTANDVKGVCIIDYLPFPFFEHSTVASLKERGVRGFKVFDSRYSLEQIERIKYFVQYKYKMLYTGGSNSLDMMTIDQEIYQRVLNMFKDEN